MLIEPLTRGHNRKSFDCGDDDVTAFLREKALQNQERDLSRTAVLIDAGVRAVVHPGGSVRDDVVIAAAQAAGVTMYFTGERHFFH